MSRLSGLRGKAVDLLAEVAAPIFVIFLVIGIPALMVVGAASCGVPY